jgi:hypothetical protein
MGLFGGGKEVHVASSVYNMAGEEKDRAHYLKNLVLRNVLSGTKRGLGETIPQGYLKGPGIKFRSFFRWAEDNYQAVGLPTGTLSADQSVTTEAVAPYISVGVNQTAWVQEAWIDNADYSYWVEQWFMENAPEKIETEWAADIDDTTKVITIIFADNTSVSFSPANFDVGAKYVFAYYTLVEGEKAEPVEEGDLVELAPGQPFPSTTGWTLLTNTPSSQTRTLSRTTTVVKSYSDGRPNTSTTNTTTSDQTFTRLIRRYQRDTNEGTDPTPGTDQIILKREFMYLYEDMEKDTDVTTSTTETVEDDVTVTTTTMITQEILVANNSYRIDKQKVIIQEFSPLKLFIYRIGSGTAALDALVEVVADYGRFFPVIPFRANSEMVSPTYQPEVYELAKKAYRKATDGAKLDKLIDMINENEDVGDIDYAYVVFGVSLNVIDKSCKRYLWEFFTRLMNDQRWGKMAYDDLITQINTYNTAYQAWEQWRNAQNDNSNNNFSESAPPLPSRPSITNNEIRINSSGSIDTNYDIRISWNYIHEGSGSGLGRPGARKGDFWFVDRGNDNFQASIYGGQESDGNGGYEPRSQVNDRNNGRIRLYWQNEVNSFKYLDITGLVHRNYIYNGKYVQITASEALEDADESGFIVPLHYGIYRAMRLVDSTQMSTACMFLVFNSYVVLKKKWYQSGFFQIIFVVVIAIVSVTLTGGAGLGLLGSHLAVGGALGLTGLTAAIVGSVANALAALVLTTLISKVAIGIFGKQWGGLIAAILSFAVMNFAVSFHTTGSFTFNIAELMKAENLLKMTNALVDGYSAYVQGSIIGMQNDLERLQEEANAELKRIQEAYLGEFGFGGGQIDPLMFVGNSPVIAESRDTFLSRTLMTGSDIAAMSHDMLTDFSSLTLTLPNAFT